MASNKSPEFKVSVCFVSPLVSQTDQTAIRAAYKDLTKQIAEFAQAVVADPNVLPSHSVVSNDPKDMVPVNRITVDSHIANLQTINERIKNGDSVAVNPKHKNRFESADDEDEVPHVVAYTDYAKAGPVVQSVAAKTGTAEAGLPPGADLKAKYKAVVFEQIRETAKSVAIVDYFLDNANKEVTTADIVAGTNLASADVGVWLATTGKKLTAIVKTGKRGCYKFDTDKANAA
jgi:hypothetical protein